MKTNLFLLSIFLILCFTLTAKAMDLRNLIIKAGSQDERLNYSGIKEAKFDQNGRTLTIRSKVSHIKPDKTRIIFLSPKEIAGTEIVKINGKVFQHAIGTNYWLETVPEIDCCASDYTDLILANFKLILSENETIANNKAIHITAQSNAIPKLKRQFFIDSDNQAILKTIVTNINGKVVFSSQYLTIDFSPKLSIDDVTKITGQVMKLSDKNQINFVVMKPSYLPGGFKFIGISRMIVNGCVCAHSRFSDGLNTISLFQHKGLPIKADFSQSNGASIGWRKAGFTFILIGDIPISELKKISKSVK
jgi:negative regulator of sigma E activity